MMRNTIKNLRKVKKHRLKLRFQVHNTDDLFIDLSKLSGAGVALPEPVVVLVDLLVQNWINFMKNTSLQTFANDTEE